MAFLSTPSARRATVVVVVESVESVISIHALREEGDLQTAAGRQVNAISIHALREEGDKSAEPVQIPLTDFYPRPPRGGRRCRPALPASNPIISIHALREEGDKYATM